MEGQTCQICRIGRFQPTQAAYMRIVQQQAVTIPNAPAFKCDVCNEVFFEAQFVQKIDYLLEQKPQPQTHSTLNQPYFEERPLWAHNRKS